jgi:hypothetical protein
LKTGLDAVQSVISEVQTEQTEASGPHADLLFTAVRALQGVLGDLEEGEDTTEELFDALR